MRPRTDGGLTLIEMMVSLGLIGLAVAAFISSFSMIQRSIQKSKSRSVAISLCREHMESLKNTPYALLRPTSQADLAAFGYDNTHLPPDAGVNGGQRWRRYSRVVKARPGPGGTVEELSALAPDAGLKKIDVWVEWKEDDLPRRYSVSSLLGNPKRQRPTGAVTGTVYQAPGGAGNELPGARVIIAENPTLSDVTGGSGSYRISTASGAFLVQASKSSYFPAVAPAAANPDASVSFVLSPRGWGSVSGFAYRRDHVVISQIVASTGDPSGFDVQYVELYNPTTSAVFVGNAGSHALRLRYASPFQSQDCLDLELTYVSSSVAAGSFYLVANTATFVVGGAAVAADAYLTDSGAASCLSVPAGWAPPASRRVIQPGQAGSVALSAASGQALDAVGWTLGAVLPPFCEGACLGLSAGLGPGEQLVRLSSPSAPPSFPAGRAFDSDQNAFDFAGPPALPGLSVSPRAGLDGPWTPLTGTPAVGALISADDDLSSPSTLVSATGYFELARVATCTATGAPASWIVTVSSGELFGAVPAAAPGLGVDLSLGTIALVSTTSAGVVTGTVRSSTGAALSGILVAAGGVSAAADAGGTYRLLVGSGTALAVTANPNHADPGFASAVSTPFDLPAGGTVSGVDFTLDPVGSVSGLVTIDGINPLPGAVVQASAPAGLERGTVTSDGFGRFLIEDLPVSALGGVGAYSVAPALDASQTSAPASISALVDQAAEVFAGTFTITGAFGKLSGTVTDDGRPITTGVLVLATQVALSTSPPVWDEGLRGGSIFYYSAHSGPDGSYVLPVRVSTAAYNVYAWYSKVSGSGLVTTLKSASMPVTSSGGAFTVSFSWP